MGLMNILFEIISEEFHVERNAVLPVHFCV